VSLSGVPSYGNDQGIDDPDAEPFLLAHPDAETAIDGMHRVATIIRERAGVLRENLDPRAE
jgi:hypothetical protein